MNQQEFLYSYSSVSIVIILFLLIMLLNEIGFHIGRFVQHRTDDEIKSLTGAVQASILGLLALLLGFTFSMSMQRYDSRNLALIEEVNSIGTTQLRVELLPKQHQNKARQLIVEYINLRISIGKIDLTQQQQRDEYNIKINQLQSQLWALAITATHDDPRPVTTGAFINALNNMIDSQGKRNALLHMHVPEVVLLLLFIVFISSGGILGYSSGLSGRRIIAPTMMVSFLIALIVFIIIDLDRPKRGLIQIDQSLMHDLVIVNTQ